MICPHCKKPIDWDKSRYKKQVMKLHKKGYSCRDIEALLDRAVSFSTVSRWVKESEAGGE